VWDRACEVNTGTASTHAAMLTSAAYAVRTRTLAVLASFRHSCRYIAVPRASSKKYQPEGHRDDPAGSALMSRVGDGVTLWVLVVETVAA
jgi:hypothetical protein